MDAEFVITDSFHGCVFSILFNIPFIAIGNEGRGLSRFQSLLKMFGLENRLVTDVSSVNIDNFVGKEIEWGEGVWSIGRGAGEGGGVFEE